MRADAISLEDGRLDGLSLDNYPWYHERHRIFPQIFTGQNYKRVIDISAGVGVVAKRIHDSGSPSIICNDISEQSLKVLKHNGLKTLSFDLDDADAHFPFADKSFDAVITLATLEHIMELDHHIMEIKRILKDDGHLYISTPNYNGIHFVLPFLFNGKTFHNPMKGGIHKYEFYAHVRYFTYETMLDFIGSFGFKAEKVFLPLPESSTKFKALKNKSKLRAFLFRSSVHLFYKVFSPRWAFHPVLCFSKNNSEVINKSKPKKVIL